MRRLALLILAVAVAGLLLAHAAPVLAAATTHDMKTTVVSVDLESKSLTIKDEKGEVMTAPVLDGAISRRWRRAACRTVADVAPSRMASRASPSNGRRKLAIDGARPDLRCPTGQASHGRANGDDRATGGQEISILPPHGSTEGPGAPRAGREFPPMATAPTTSTQNGKT